MFHPQKYIPQNNTKYITSIPQYSKTSTIPQNKILRFTNNTKHPLTIPYPKNKNNRTSFNITVILYNFTILILLATNLLNIKVDRKWKSTSSS